MVQVTLSLSLRPSGLTMQTVFTAFMAKSEIKVPNLDAVITSCSSRKTTVANEPTRVSQEPARKLCVDRPAYNFPQGLPVMTTRI